MPGRDKEEIRSYSLAYYHANKNSERQKEHRRKYNEKRRQGRPAKGDYGPRGPSIKNNKQQQSDLYDDCEPRFI